MSLLPLHRWQFNVMIFCHYSLLTSYYLSLSFSSCIPITTQIFFSTASPTSVPTIISITGAFLKQCKTLNQTKVSHQKIIVNGLLDLDIDLIATYITCEAPAQAILLLENLPPSSSTIYWWNVLIKRSLSMGHLDDVLSLFQRMLRFGWRADHYTFPYVLKACGSLPSFRRGASIHGIVCVHGFEYNVFVCNAMMAMYGRCGVLNDALQMFNETLQRRIEDVVSWNSILAAFVQNGQSKDALKLAVQMATACVNRHDAVTLVTILSACASVGRETQGKQVHAYAVRSGLLDDVFVGNAIIDMCAKCGKMDDANKVFKRMVKKDVISWNSMVTGYSQIGMFNDALALFEKMRQEEIELNVVTWSAVIAGYAQSGQGLDALDVFRKMQLNGSEPNVVTFVSLLSSCASIGSLLHGRETHCYALKHVLNSKESDPGDDLMLLNGLIDMYAKCKSFRVARMIFDSTILDDRNVVTWTTMIGGYAQHGEANSALELFSEMFKHDTSIKPNAFTICCSLMACARLASLRIGKQIHAYVYRDQDESEVLYVCNCLIDMYSKSGDVDTARVVFDTMKQRNTVSWTSLMTGYAMHGRGEEAIQVFDEMRRVGLVVDDVTFVVVLYACSHAGMVDQGMKYFNHMQQDFGVIPAVEHYACMVDLLGRAGRLNEAMELIRGMPMKPTTIVWVALLSSSRTHANVDLGEYAAKELAELESENDGSLTLLSNLYANARRWKDVARIRLLMRDNGIRKRPGCSWVQGKHGIATFFVGDRTHPMSQDIYKILAELIRRIKDKGYVPQTSYALHDVDDEEKSDLLFEHSEKLALAYGILTTSKGSPIRITKNLRVCGDCHSAITYISMIIDHEIILRDSSRFHHFKNGSCSCRGYW